MHISESRAPLIVLLLQPTVFFNISWLARPMDLGRASASDGPSKCRQAERARPIVVCNTLWRRACVLGRARQRYCFEDTHKSDTSELFARRDYTYIY